MREQWPLIQLPGDLKEAVFIHRLNRFAAEVLLGGRSILAHVPSSGRMRELLYPGARVFVQELEQKPGRKLDYKLLLAEHGGILVSLDSLLPNRLMRKALQAGRVRGFGGYNAVRPEAAYGLSRFDFRLPGADRDCLIEVKSVTLVEGRVAMFPDAPSQRGARHLQELAGARGEGLRAAVFFIVQRGDAHCFSPNDRGDEEFGRALRHAVSRGVEVYAYRCRVGPDAVTMDVRIETRL